MEAYIPRSIEELEKRLEVGWPNLQQAREESNRIKTKLEDLPKISSSEPPFPSDDISFVVFGSLARKEFTNGSDIDWTLLVDGRANPQHLEVALKFKELIKPFLHEPGQEGTFGGLTFSQDIIHKIGGDDDTNKNTTRRILLLLESHSIGDDKAQERVKRKVLSRYILEDSRPTMSSSSIIPRFLLNDIIRYWRTMAVDFGYKRRQRNWEGAAIRIIKLRMSRKLIYVSGLLACFACEMDRQLFSKYSKAEYPEKQGLIVDYLYTILNQTPLDILASIVLSNEDKNELYSFAREVFSNYNRFIGIMSDDENRSRLGKLRQDQVDSDSLYKECRDICKGFENGLKGIFLSENGTELFRLIKDYGVF